MSFDSYGPTGTIGGGGGGGTVTAVTGSLGIVSSGGNTPNITPTYGTGASTITQGNDSRVVNAVQSSRLVSASTGLSGGGDLTADVSLAVIYGTAAGTAAQGNDSRIVNAVQTTRTLTAGNGLTGGGTLAADRTFTVLAADSSIAVAAGGISVSATLPTATTFSAAATALTVTNNATISGTLTNAAITATGGMVLTSGLAAGSATTDFRVNTTNTRTAGNLMDVRNNSSTVFALGYDGSGTWTQAVATTGSPTGWTWTGAAHTTLTASAEATDVNINMARTVQFATGALTTQRGMRIQAPTYAFVGASTITNAYTVEISGAPTAGTNATLTNPFALNIAAGNVRMAGTINWTGNGTLTCIGSGGGGFTINTALTASNAGVDCTITTTTTRTAGAIMDLRNNGTQRVIWDYHGGCRVVQGIAATGTAVMLTLTGGAHTGQTASTEINFVGISQGTVTWATGAITTQRCYLFSAPTLAFAAASTVTTAATLAVSAAPVAGTNATITTAIALWVQAGLTRLDGNVLVGASGVSIAFFGATVATQQAGAVITNSVTAGGTNDTVANYTDLTIYANDAAAIRNDIYQLARMHSRVEAALRTYGLLS